MPNIDKMVNRFLSWKLPADFNPDGSIKFFKPNLSHGGYAYEWPIGTNLFTAEQVKALFEYVLEDNTGDVSVLESDTHNVWLAIEEDGTEHCFPTEADACAFQQGYRAAKGLDPITGMQV